MATTIYRTSNEMEPVTYRTSRYSGIGILYLILDVVEALLAFRFLLRAFAANPFSPFVSFIYAVTNPLVAPFRGIFPQTAGFTVDWAALVAMAVYALVVYAIVRLVELARG